MITTNLKNNTPKKYLDGERPSYSKMNNLLYNISKIISFLLGHTHTGDLDGSILGKSAINTTSFENPGVGLVPQNAILIWTGTTCPAGYTVQTTWGTDNRYLKASTTGDGSFGGNYEHNHNLSHVHDDNNTDTEKNLSHNQSYTWHSSGAIDASPGFHGRSLLWTANSHKHVISDTADAYTFTHYHSIVTSRSTGNTTSAVNDLYHVNVLFCKKD